MQLHKDSSISFKGSYLFEIQFSLVNFWRTAEKNHVKKKKICSEMKLQNEGYWPRNRLLKTRVEIQHFPLEGYSQEMSCTQSLEFHLQILKNRQIPNSCISMYCSKKDWNSVRNLCTKLIIITLVFSLIFSYELNWKCFTKSTKEYWQFQNSISWSHLNHPSILYNSLINSQLKSAHQMISKHFGRTKEYWQLQS